MKKIETNKMDCLSNGIIKDLVMNLNRLDENKPDLYLITLAVQILIRAFFESNGVTLRKEHKEYYEIVYTLRDNK